MPARWAHPLWAVLALVVSMFWYMGRLPCPCTSAEPCGTDWSGLGMMVVLVVTPYWVWRQPRLALVGLAAGLVGFAEDGGFTESFGEPYALAYPWPPRSPPPGSSTGSPSPGGSGRWPWRRPGRSRSRCPPPR